MSELDCERCGACCANLPQNVAEGFFDWVEIEDGAPLLRRADLVRKLVRYDQAGAPHLRLVSSGGSPPACAALRGALGKRVSCSIYHLRPRPCRTVQPGDGSCLEARAQHGLA